MSEPKLISPMLDNFEMGGTISDHDGVRCCPAMRKNSDEKYIVKIISIPSSQTKLDALLLTGAFQDQNAALSYFMDQADGIADEKRILDNLAQLEGFVPFSDCQIVPMDDATGYDVYLLSEYKMTLERQNSKEPMTQLAAVNLGLDLCAALSACRRSGYMYVDLKPSNIYVVGDKEYRIGDLGFVRLNSLKYESLPDKYRSCYTAPELEDVFALLNDTVDVYAMGLILYQIFNGGVLPFSGQQAPSEKFEAPAYADDEMAEIILKACDPNPAERWQDPVLMGQAIVGYMQKNGVNETPLTAEFFGPEEENASETEDAQLNAEEITPAAAAIDEETVDNVVAANGVAVDEVAVDEYAAANEAEVDAETENATDNTAPEGAIPEDLPAEEVVDSDADDKSNAAEVSDNSEDDYNFLADLDAAEKILADVGDDYNGVTEELSEILGQIDDLASHQVPDPVVAPEPIELKIPEPEEVFSDEETIGEETEQIEETPESEPVEVSAADEPEEEEIPEEERPYTPKKKRTGLVVGIILAVLIALGVGAYFFYTQYYLQPVHYLELDGSEDRLQVQLSADIDETMLSVVCADPHGEKIVAPVVGGTAAFSGLTPDTAYTVTVEVDGFHKLTGVVSKVYSTPVQTQIVQMSVVTGSEDGSVILSFTVDGPDSAQWNVIFNAEGEAERVTAFPSHVVTLAGLSVGKEYTFRLEPAEEIYISGDTEITYTVKNVICSENLHIASFMDNTLVAQWDTPADESVESWSVRCYSEAGYDETVTTSDNTATFENIDESVAYTVEVTAADMSVNQRVVVGANAITVNDFTVVNAKPDVLTLNWSPNRDIPAAGWTIRYSIDGVNASNTVTTDSNSVEIPVVPNGNYVFTILDDAGNAVLGGPFTFTQAAASDFEGFGINSSEITTRLCKTPGASSWSYKDLDDEDYVNSFAAGEGISVVFALSGDAEDANDSVAITYAIYNENNELVSFAHDSQAWQAMWYENYCELDLPGVPMDVGTYNAIIYFNGMVAGSQKFEITA